MLTSTLAVDATMNQPPALSPEQSDTPARNILCPVCGYDLRGGTGERCSECGLVIDHADLARSAMPWAYRREIGRVRAFMKTVWVVTLDLKSIRHEAAKPQSARDAAVFRRCLTAVVTPCLAGLAVVIILNEGIEELVVQKRTAYGAMVSGGLTGWQQDLLVPWSAGIALPGALFVYAALAAAVTTRAPAAVVRAPGSGLQQVEAARAIGGYSAAPLAWLAPAMAAFVLAVLVGPDRNGIPESPRLFPIASGTWCLLALLAFGGTVYRTGQWRVRITHGGYATGFLAMGELLLRWVVGLGVVFFIVPWCVGFLWIVIDSFRG